jgi:hypothetical protein
MLEPEAVTRVAGGKPFDDEIDTSNAWGGNRGVSTVTAEDSGPALDVESSTLADSQPVGDQDRICVGASVFSSEEGRAGYVHGKDWQEPAIPTTATLLGHLASVRRDVFSQAEVLCTLSLAWILSRSASAADAFTGVVAHAGGPLVWTAEDREVSDGGRPDLVGRATPGGSALAIVEAKLGAPVDESQLRRFLCSGATLTVLVPAARSEEVRRRLAASMGEVLVVSWERVLMELRSAVAEDASVTGDLAQLVDLYHQVERTVIAPFSSADLLSPLRRRNDLVRLVDQVAGKLTADYGTRRYPLFQRNGSDSRRYVHLPAGFDVAVVLAESVMGSLGTPLALMVHRHTTRADVSQLVALWSEAGYDVVRQGGHAYVGVGVPLGLGQTELVARCADQAREMLACFLRDLAGR